jgi:hypothetical protein
MMKVHGCKKCQGTLILEKDEFGWYEECIHCGYSRDIPLDLPVERTETDSFMTVKVASNSQKLVDKWKHDKTDSYQPINKLTTLEEAY